MDDAQLRTIWQQRQPRARLSHLSEPLTILMKHNLAKKVRQLSRLAEIWDEIIPDQIANHTALDGFTRGVLTVLVDSAAHRYQLRTLLDGGLIDAVRERFSGAIDKVRLLPGQFYAVDVTGAPRYQV